MHFFEDIEIGAAARVGLVHLHRGFNQDVCHAIRSAALSPRRGGGAQVAVRRAGRVRLARRVHLHEAAGRRRQAPDEGGRARGEEVAVWGPSPGFRELRWIRPVLAGDTISFSNQVETKRTSESVPNGASCRPATPAPTSAAKWCSRSWRRPSCRGGTRAPDAPRYASMVTELLPYFAARDDSPEPFFC